MDAAEENAYSLGVQALLWGYPLLCYAATNQEAVTRGASHVNAYRRFADLKTAADRYVAMPNNVTLDCYGLAVVDDEPVVVHVPALTEPRWYIVQIGDMFDEVIRNIGGTKGPQPGAYVVAGPDYRGDIPGDMTLVRTRTRQAIVAARVFVDGQADLNDARRAQSGFHLLPLSAYLRQGITYQPTINTAYPSYEDSAPEALRRFDQLGQAMQWFLPASADTADTLVTAFHTIGLNAGTGFAWQILDESTKKGLARAVQVAEDIIDARWADLGETVNGWRYNTAGGRAGRDFALRAALAKYQLGDQLAVEVLYPPTTVDADGRPLEGSKRYTLRFPAGERPPVSQFWNLGLYDSDMLFIENELGRYTIGSTTDGLTSDRDGSLTLYLQQDRPDNESAVANWLPAPNGPFTLVMRFYGPSTSVLDGTYRLPPITMDS